MAFLDDVDLSNAPTIPEYYKGKTIFITGGSGFMGQTLIEKLLYSCTDLDRIYLLLRPKKGVKSEDRIASIYSSFCFDRLKKERPGVFNAKVFAISGDVKDIELGLSEADRALIINRVNIIFHVAASVRFNDTLPDAVTLNLRGTRELVKLAKEINDLSALVHVSTSYSNTTHQVIDEKMYPPLANWRETIQICQNIDLHSIQVLTDKYKGEMPNTYVFTKHLAEHVIYEEKGRLPAIIIRPSIVVSSIEEPFPGWIDNFNGPVGITVAVGKGIMRSFYSGANLNIDFVPVDVSIKNFIAAAWMRGIQKLQPTDDIVIYNCCATNMLSFTMGETCELGVSVLREMPVNNAMWYPRASTTSSKPYHYVNVIMFQLIPAMFIDLLLWLTGKKPILVKIQRRMLQADIALRYYINKEWTFINNNFVLLCDRLKEQDKKAFWYKIEGLNKFSYLVEAIGAGKKCLLKEYAEDLPKAKAHIFKLMILDYVVKFLFFGYIFLKLWNSIYFENLVQSFVI